MKETRIYREETWSGLDVKVEITDGVREYWIFDRPGTGTAIKLTEKEVDELVEAIQGLQNVD